MARLCLELGCLPSQLRNEKVEDVEAIYSTLLADAEFQKKQANKNKR